MFAVDAYTSSGGGEPEDEVEIGEPGSGGEFMVVTSQDGVEDQVSGRALYVD